MTQRFLTALPVYNEAAHVDAVLAEVRRYSDDVLVVDDGSTDGTARLLAAQMRAANGERASQREIAQGELFVVRHEPNRGYGAALKTAFEFAIREAYDVLVTIDCDGQHEPQRIPRFVAAAADADIVSGSRYLKQYPGDNPAPEDRRRINLQITADLNRRLCLNLTDAFCGFKAYRVSALKRLTPREPGYAMPLELWVQAAHGGLSVLELPVPLIYLDEKRSFGGTLDDAARRLDYYHQVIDRSVADLHEVPGRLHAGKLCRDAAG